MQDHKNQHDEERNEQQANLKATENMGRNSDSQNETYRIRQNELTQSTDNSEESNSLLNTHEQGDSNDSVSIKDKNRERLEMDKDADFGNEQLE